MREALRDEVLACIRRGFRSGPTADPFPELALKVFAYQYAENEAYRRYCDRRDRTPATVSSWADIPAVPTAAFREAPLVCGSAEGAEAVFRTSGTTRGRERRGTHYVRDLSLYRASALRNFEAHVMPEGLRLTMLILAPSARLAPDSSLSWMLDRVMQELGGPESGHYVDQEGLRASELVERLDSADAEGEPVCLLGTALALVHLLDGLSERDRGLKLPLGSRLMETGGFKGQDREVPRDEFYADLEGALGLSGCYIVSEYGMTEMCSQFYDNVLRDRVRARSPGLRYKVVPPWVRTQVVDPETLEPLPAGQVGVLRHWDLANLDSVIAIQTDDLGVAAAEGFDVLGRATGAEARGCSIAMDEWLSAQR